MSAEADAATPMQEASLSDGEDAAGGPVARSAVRWFGALSAIMHEGRTESAVLLADVVPGPHAWGVGALEGLAGEVTLLDDIVWLAQPKPDGTVGITHLPASDVDRAQGAALLVVGNVHAWDALPVTQDLAFSGLDAYLETQLRARGEPLEAPVPVRIDGNVKALAWHVIDGSKMQAGGGHHVHHARASIQGVLENVDAQLVGFFSRDHQGVFTHMGSNSHFHVVTRDGAVTGHVDSVDLSSGARLLVPRR